MNEPSRPVVRRVLVIAVALLIAAIAFLFRFNALGGALGGFDNEEFATLTRVDMVLSGQQPLRDFADGELRAAWPSLSFEVPALAQRIWGRNLFVYACLTLGALALCAAIVFLLAFDLARSWTTALLAAAVLVMSVPISFNYQKVLSLTLGATAIWWAVRQPTAGRLAVLAAATIIAALFRHDYGVYVGIGAVAGLIACEPRPWTVPVRRLATYAALLAMISLPSIVWVARNTGVGRYMTDVLGSVSADTATNPPLGLSPAVDLAAPFGIDSLLAVNYYAYWIMPVAALAALAIVWRRRPAHGLDARIGYGLALIAMTPVVNHFLLRSHLQARFGDAIVPMVLLAPWIAGVAPLLASQGARVVARVGPPVVLAMMGAAFIPINEIPQELRTGSLNGSPAAALRRFQTVKETLRALPPNDWTGQDTRGTLAAARYLAECTLPDDQVLVATYADEVPYFARRRFAGGQAYFAFSFLRSEADQRLVLERLARQSVPVALTAVDFDGEIGEDYPLLARYLHERYREQGIIEADGKPFVRVWVDAARQPVRADPVLGFPCFK